MYESGKKKTLIVRGNVDGRRSKQNGENNDARHTGDGCVYAIYAKHNPEKNWKIKDGNSFKSIKS